MSQMTELDLPLVRSLSPAGGQSGYSWFLHDVDGVEWQIYVGEEGLLNFVSAEDRATKHLSRQQFYKLFREEY